MNKSRIFRLALAAASASIISIGAASAQQTMTIHVPGANWGESFDNCVIKPFAAANNVTFRLELGNSTTAFAKLQQQRGNPVIDVAWMDGGISELALAEGVIDTLDPEKVPNLKNLLPEAATLKDGKHFSASVGYYSLGIVYNTKSIKEPPKSWNDLWDDKYADEVTIPAPANAAGVPFILFLDRFWHKQSDLDATFKKLKTLKASRYFDTSGTASNSFQTGEATIGANFNVSAWDLADKGMPIAFTVPKEGFWANDGRVHIVKGTKNKELAEKLLNTALSAEAATCLADKLYLGPSVAGAQVSAATAPKLPWGATGSIKSLVKIDWSEINAQRAKLIEMWNREMARK